jgi:hypothetical protein
LPTTLCDSSPFSLRRSIPTVTSESTIPVKTPSDGITQSRCASAWTILYRRMAAKSPMRPAVNGRAGALLGIRMSR